MGGDELMTPDGKSNELGQAVGGFAAPDLTKAEYDDHFAKAIANGLEATRLVEVVEVTSAVGQAHLMCRVRAGDEREFVHGPITSMARRMAGVAETFFGKEFFLKGSGPAEPRRIEIPEGEERTPSDYAEFLSEVIDKTGLAEVVEKKHAPGQVHFQVRVKSANEKNFVHGPVKAMLLLLKGKADAFFGKEFFLKDDNMVYAWVISIGSEDLRRASFLVQYALENFENVFQDDDPDLKYAWITSFGAQDLGPVVRAVSEALDGHGPRLIVTEAPLLGPGTPVGSTLNRSGGKGTRGASPIRG